jgi:hypothetical protein
MARDGEHFFMCVWPFEFLVLRKFCLVHFLIDSLILVEFSFLSSLYIQVISALSDVASNIFSHSMGGLFSIETISFVV